MELPECHDAAVEKAAEACCQHYCHQWTKLTPTSQKWWLDEVRIAITAYLSALKDQGLMREAHQYSYAKGKFWEATTILEDHNALIIRMEQK